MRVGFGLARLHHLLSARQRERVLLGALDAGCVHFDVAPAYGDGLCEAEIGRVLRHRRREFTLATKFGIPVSALGARSPALYFAGKALRRAFSRGYGGEYARRDFGAGTMRRSLEDSLRRLRTDHVDELFLHDPRNAQEAARIEALAEPLEQLRRDGKLRRWGISGSAALLGDAARGAVALGDTVQFELSGPAEELGKLLPAGMTRFAFGLVRRLAGRPGERIDMGGALEWFGRAFPGVTPVVATNRVEELARLRAAISRLSGP